MALNAFENGVTILTEDVMNELLALQAFKLLYEGTAIDSKSDSGTTENNVFDYYFAVRFTATGVTSITRGELTIAMDGSGADLTATILDSDFDPGGSAEGAVLKTIIVPKEHLPASAATVYVPIDLSGLTDGNNYWIKVSKVGDSTNHFHLVGEASQDAAHPCYRRAGTSGAWTANNAIHFAVYDGNSGETVHGIYGTSLVETYIYTGEDLSHIYRYCPPYGKIAGGIRDIIAITFDGDYLTDGAVT